jgi:hypothetical protein
MSHSSGATTNANRATGHDSEQDQPGNEQDQTFIATSVVRNSSNREECTAACWRSIGPAKARIRIARSARAPRFTARIDQ